MKRKLIYGFAAFILMALIPLISVGSIERDTQAVSLSSSDENTVSGSGGSSESIAEDESSTAASDNKATIEESAPEKDDKEQGFRILDTSTGKVITVEEKEFCCGALGYEMAPLYEIEALKAQCVACYTHFCRLRDMQRSSPDPELKGADFSADLSNNQFWLSDDAMRKKWGDLYERSRKRIDLAVNGCFGEVLCDDKGELIDAAYFALSSGNTENAKDIFGADSPYLRAVASPFDLKAPDQISEKIVSTDELRSALKGLNSKAELYDKKGNRIAEPERTASGSVLKIQIGNCEFSGGQIREALGLRSANFDIEDKGDSFLFTVRGYGHGVGMSQYGANALAQQGASYKEILSHYYGNAQLRSITAK